MNKLLGAAVLSGCPSLSQRAELPPSIDRAQALEQSGDRAGAARVYEGLAAQNSGTDRTGYLLRAANDYLAARRPEDAARVLNETQGPYSADQATERGLLGAEVALALGQPQEAARELRAMPEPADPAMEMFWPVPETVMVSLPPEPLTRIRSAADWP